MKENCYYKNWNMRLNCCCYCGGDFYKELGLWRVTKLTNRNFMTQEKLAYVNFKNLEYCVSPA